MGGIESTLKATTVRPIVRSDSLSPLPTFALDTAKFSDGSVGFLATKTDLAKNVTTQNIVLKHCIQTTETSYLFIGTDDTLLTFMVDLLTKKVYCKVESGGSVILRPCVTTYEALEDSKIDILVQLYRHSKPLS
jgi:hypothetical protein